MKRCNLMQCKQNNNGLCKLPKPEVTSNGECLNYEPDECIFNAANRGKCCQKTVTGSDFCPEHKGSKCIVCGKQAVKQCLWPVDDEDRVCEALLCRERECFKKHKAECHDD